MNINPFHGSASMSESGGSKKTIKNSAKDINDCVQNIMKSFDSDIQFTRFIPKEMGSSTKQLSEYMREFTQTLRGKYAGQPSVEKYIKELKTALNAIQTDELSEKSKTIENIIGKLNKILNFESDLELDANLIALQEEAQKHIEKANKIDAFLSNSVLSLSPQQDNEVSAELEELEMLQELEKLEQSLDQENEAASAE